ncbi:speckle targeted PIP5K1A-regulated poly(A) polymerase-like [Pollicipes pollicipes]|uniref:speckle targeted PIP5K1A-regulated poly(A) polymerase-like n=1 Tax=Pollicipes pollicipes TaxID=41117 RepID=UPI0018856978|nr:speckle targeted PIP5K1A-regulated poly(A) polymerase-like [Pollicipes pollicipes]
MPEQAAMSASWCRFCDVRHTSDGAAREHLLGKSHQRKVAELPPATGDAAPRCVALKGPSSFYGANPSPMEIFQRLETSGKIVDFRFRTRPDKTLVRGSTIHVEFETTCEAETLLSSGTLIAGHQMELSRPRANGRSGHHLRQDASEAVQHEALLSWLWRQRSRCADELMVWLAGQLLLTPAEHDQRVRFCLELQAELRARFRTCLVQAFGSSVSGLGFHGCDLDLYAYIDANAPDAGLPTDADEADRARAVAAVLQGMRRPDLCSRLVRILQARVPIIKFCARRLGGVRCDMSFRSPMSCQNSRLVGWFMKADQRARLVAVTLRYWANRHHVAGGDHNPRKMSSYCLTLLVITFLQQLDPPLLPSVAWLQAQVPEVLIGPWNAAFALGAPWRSANQSTASGLLRHFFRYGADLQSERLAVCPLVGRAVPREQLADRQHCYLPELRRYFGLVADHQVAPLDAGTPLVVQDPFELDFNVARNYSQEGLDRFRECCARAVTMPFHELFEEEPLMKTRGKKAPPAGAGRTDGGAEAVSRKRERLVSGDASAGEAGTKVPRSAEFPETARRGRSVESTAERGTLELGRGDVDAAHEESSSAERVSGLAKGDGAQLSQRGDSDAKGVMWNSVGDEKSPSGVDGTQVDEAMAARVGRSRERRVTNGR